METGSPFDGLAPRFAHSLALLSSHVQLENMSRKTLKELNVEYERKAFAAMQLESSQANDQNLSLQNDLRDNSLQVSALMASHQEKHVALRKMRLERDLLMSATAIQETRLETLEDAKADHEEIIAGARMRLSTRAPPPLPHAAA